LWKCKRGTGHIHVLWLGGDATVPLGGPGAQGCKRSRLQPKTSCRSQPSGACLKVTLATTLSNCRPL
jgi:hypothetical protein